MGRVVLLSAALVLLAGCREHLTVAPTPPHARARWLLEPDADDRDLFCVDSWAGVDAGVRCTTVKDVRAYVRYKQAAN